MNAFDLFKKSIPVFAYQTQAVDQIGFGKKMAEDRRKLFFDMVDTLRFERVGQGDVKVELFHHMGIAPLIEISLLNGRELCPEPPCAFDICQGRAKPVDPSDNLTGQGFERSLIAPGNKAQDAAHPRERQTGNCYRAKL